MLARLSADVRQYLPITGNYWAFTLTDGALRMLVVLHFHQLGYSPLQIAMFLIAQIVGVTLGLIFIGQIFPLPPELVQPPAA